MGVGAAAASLTIGGAAGGVASAAPAFVVAAVVPPLTGSVEELGGGSFAPGSDRAGIGEVIGNVGFRTGKSPLFRAAEVFAVCRFARSAGRPPATPRVCEPGGDATGVRAGARGF